MTYVSTTKATPTPLPMLAWWVVTPHHVAPNLKLLFLKRFNGDNIISVKFKKIPPQNITLCKFNNSIASNSIRISCRTTLHKCTLSQINVIPPSTKITFMMGNVLIGNNVFLRIHNLITLRRIWMGKHISFQWGQPCLEPNFAWTWTLPLNGLVKV